MRDRLRFFGFLALFWMSFFTLGRILFLLYLLPQTHTLTFYEIAMPLLLGLRMDAAMTGYWLLLPGLLFAASAFTSNRFTFYSVGIVTATLLLISAVLVVADVELYKHWGFRINSTPLMYMESEAASSVNPNVLVILILIFVTLLGTFLFIYARWLGPRLLALTPIGKKRALTWLLITVALIIPIRSSFSVAPLNTGVVYFHKKKSFPNHAGINPVWNFFRSVSRSKNFKYPHNLYKPETLVPDFERLMHTSGKTEMLIDTTVHKPNVLLIILEGFTSKIVEPLGGLSNITPRLNALVSEGILFENFYASGDRTDKGIVSILSAYPAQPKTSIIKFPDKTQKLSFLSRELEQNGYHTSFIYGGDIGFANMESYVTLAGFSAITEEGDFDNDLDDSKWGVADHYVFDRMLDKLDSANAPFFKVMLSLSSHEPFEVPMETVIEGEDEGSLYLNSCYYTDKSLGEFIRQAKQKTWWKNTLVIITADHGHRFPDPKELKDKDRFKIPMLWLGGVITKPGTRISTFAAQPDIAHTLLGQLQITPATGFSFSRNILAEHVNPFAVYIFNNGYGYVSENHQSIYDFDLRHYLKDKGNKNELLWGQAYVQTLFNDYNRK
ncbi:MAG: sulfatase-like hydrolase/transferase [Cyclobacteriaceae bacterium]|nr:sulfatase-like hydrolase/transferase [Cyclobacteriaceae bacterium]